MSAELRRSAQQMINFQRQKQVDAQKQKVHMHDAEIQNLYPFRDPCIHVVFLCTSAPAYDFGFYVFFWIVPCKKAADVLARDIAQKSTIILSRITGNSIIDVVSLT